jgi:predicted ATPase
VTDGSQGEAIRPRAGTTPSSPAPGGRLIGRDDDTERIAARLAPGTVVTAVGPGGVGKTRLVHAVAERRVLEGESVRIGLLATIARDADQDAVADALGFESADAATVVLVDRPALLVLDNCEHVLDGVRRFVSLLRAAAPDTTFVATSREPLGLADEQVVVVPPLGIPAPGGADADSSPAVQLFLDRATAAGAVLVASPRMLADVGELCRRLDGLPLAIELAAARSRAIAPSDLLNMVDQRLDLLRRTSGGADRHDSMRAAIEVSTAMLAEHERRFFDRLAVFSGPFDLALAHAVAGDPDAAPLDSLELLAGLVERSLVVGEVAGGMTRYRLLELLREHAVGELRSTGELPAVEERFVETMVAVADDLVLRALERWDPTVLAGASAQFSNLTKACELCVDRDPGPERSFRLLVPMFAAVHEGRAHEVHGLGGRVLARWPDEAAPWRPEAIAVIATAASLAGRLDEVPRLAALVVDDPDASPVALALAQRAWGLATRAHGPGIAVEHFRAARTAAEEIGFNAVARELQALEAGETDLAGRRDDAIVLLDDLLELCQVDEDLFVSVLAHLVRARVWLRAGDIDAATTDLGAAERASLAIEQLWWNGAILRTRAALASLSPAGWAAAGPHWRAAVDFAAGLGALGEVAITLRSAASVAHHLGEVQAGQILWGAAPSSTAITVLPELFPEAMADLESRTPAAPPGASPVDALARARAALGSTIGAAPAGPRRRATDLGSPAAPVATGPGDRPTPNEWVREGDVWRITFGGRTARVRHVKGLLDLATLLAAPGTERHALELMGGADTTPDAGPQLDERARREYQARIVELQRDIDEAHDHNDTARAERAEHELDALVTQLSEAFGLSGRSRTTGSSAERARSAVTYRIRSAIRKAADVHPELGRHLKNAVRTGTWCCYQPETDVTWTVVTTT